MTLSARKVSVNKEEALPQTNPRIPIVQFPQGLPSGESPTVEVVQYAYRVDWGSGAPGFGGPRFHHVNKNRRCDCALGCDCPSVEAVKKYLADGGSRAPDYPAGFWPSVPEHCPICGSSCVAHPSFNFREHGVGWACTVGGTLHYWEARTVRIKKVLAAQKGQPRWVIPPAHGPNGEVLYPGVTIEEMERARAEARRSTLQTCHSTHNVTKETTMNNSRIVRVPSLAAFMQEVPPADGKPAVVRLAASESALPQNGKGSIPRKSIGVSLQGINTQGEIVWLQEGHIIVWLADGPGFGVDRSIYDGVMALKDIVRDHLVSLGYDVHDGDYALPSNLQPLNARFECARWVKVGDQELQVTPVSGS
jgi:hypothetical protein